MDPQVQKALDSAVKELDFPKNYERSATWYQMVGRSKEWRDAITKVHEKAKKLWKSEGKKGDREVYTKGDLTFSVSYAKRKGDESVGLLKFNAKA